MSKIYFDLRDGAMLIGDAAITPRLEQSGIGDVIPLAELLRAEEVSREYARQSRGAWTNEDFLALGRVAFDLLRQLYPGTGVTLENRDMERMYELGIGPDPAKMVGKKRGIKSYEDIRTEIGAPPGYKPRGMFDDWTLADYVRYAAEVEAAVGGKPRPEDYDAYARRHRDKPPLHVVKKIRGGIKSLNERIGYPNFQTWEPEEYVDFGVKFIEVNGLDLFTSTAFEVLHKRRRGPRYLLIRKKFDSWPSYKSLVLEAAAEQAEAQKFDREAKLQKYESLIEDGALPRGGKDLSERDLLVWGARHMLISALFGCKIRSAHRKAALSAKTNRTFVHALLEADATQSLHIGRIELEASIIGVYDDLWPMDQYKQYLRVSAEELATRKADAAEKMRQYRNCKALQNLHPGLL